jgi:adenine/guanine phosphoribosyltransferase-like PRPP-binding protein
VEKLGGRVAGYSFITELKGLEGYKKLPEEAIVDTLIAL